MFFTGTFERTLDDKLRLAIPKQLREGLGAGPRLQVYVAPGTDGSLAVYPEAGFAALAEQFARRSPTGEEVRTFSRLFFAQAQRVEIDGQGRIRLPANLITLARFGRELVLIGVRDHWEIWDRRHWEQYVAEKQPHYDEIAEAAFSSHEREMAAQPLRPPVNPSGSAATSVTKSSAHSLSATSAPPPAQPR